jgi:folate-binding protein YgfZ
MEDPMAVQSLLELHTAAGAAIGERDGVAVALAYPSALARPLTPDTVIGADLSHRPVFRLVGDDVRRWTNGMFTNNTRRLQPGQGNRHCACDDRGRVKGVLDLYFLASDCVRIVLDGMLLEDFEQRYQMYLLLDDIEMEADEVAVLTVQGRGTDTLLASLELPAPAEDHGHEAATGPWDGVVVCRRDRIDCTGVDLLVPTAQAAALWQALLAAGVRPMGVDDLHGLRVVAGRVTFPTDASDKSMVHELGLNTDCCAFDKGCYVGQEIINRIDVRGAFQKRVTTVLLEDAVPLGSSVRMDGKVMGKLTSRTTYNGQELGLGVLRKAAWPVGTELTVPLDDGSEVAGRVVEVPVF